MCVCRSICAYRSIGAYEDAYTYSSAYGHMASKVVDIYSQFVTNYFCHIITLLIVTIQEFAQEVILRLQIVKYV